MNILDLDERSISIIEALMEYFSSVDENNIFFMPSHGCNAIKDKIERPTTQEVYELYWMMNELDVGEYVQKNDCFTVNKMKLRIFQSNGGIRNYIAKQKNSENQSEEKLLLETSNLKLQIEQLKHESERRKNQIEIDKLTIKNLKRNNKILSFFFVITIMGWIIDFLSENAQWGWSFFKEKSRTEKQLDKNDRLILFQDSLQSNHSNNLQTNDTIK